MSGPPVERTTLSIDQLQPADYNPRTITKAARAGLAASIERWGLVQEVVVNRRGLRVIGGHQRLDVLREQGITQVPVAIVDLTEAEERALNVALNAPTIAGDFTAALVPMIEAIKVQIPSIAEILRLDQLAAQYRAADAEATIAHASLQARFGVPPFSVLDARQGYWQERKRAWIALGIQSELGRGDSSTTSPFRPGTIPGDVGKLLKANRDNSGGANPTASPGRGETPTATPAADGRGGLSDQLARPRQPTPTTWRVSAAWGSKRLNCTPAGITRAGGCGGACCYGPTFWPGKASGRADHACAHLGPEGCTLSPADKPVTCHLYPLKLNAHGTLVVHGRAPIGCCKPNWGDGPMVIEALQPGLAALFGNATAQAIVDSVKAGEDYDLAVPPSIAEALDREAAWEAANAIPGLRSQL